MFEDQDVIRHMGECWGCSEDISKNLIINKLNPTFCRSNPKNKIKCMSDIKVPTGNEGCLGLYFMHIDSKYYNED